MSLTGHLMDKANIVSHGADHVDQGVLLHLDRRVRDEDEGVEGGSISWQHVVDLWVHSWWGILRKGTHPCTSSSEQGGCKRVLEAFF